jgi:hypothetical protein
MFCMMEPHCEQILCLDALGASDGRGALSICGADLSKVASCESGFNSSTKATHPAAGLEEACVTLGHLCVRRMFNSAHSWRKIAITLKTRHYVPILHRRKKIAKCLRQLLIVGLRSILGGWYRTNVRRPYEKRRIKFLAFNRLHRVG